LADSALHGTWLYAIPVPICAALSGTLICKWFAKYDESAAIAANFWVSTLILIPVTGFILYQQHSIDFGQEFPVILMIIGTIVAESIGRVAYQIALTFTANDNGFVTMFFLLIPALTALISLPLSWWISDLHFAVLDGRRIKIDHEPVQHGVVVASVEINLDSRLLRRLIADLEEDLGGAASIVGREAGMARRDCRPPTKDSVRATKENDDIRVPIMANSLQSFLDSIPLGSRGVIALVECHADDDRILDQLFCRHYELRRLALGSATMESGDDGERAVASQTQL
jgi:hypothetical protein